jgi:trehalose 6-phosphate phosphatase
MQANPNMNKQKNNNRYKEQLKTQELKAVILDMDGVITQTAIIHREAWKEMFNRYFNDLPAEQGPMSDEDYIRYIDGKPRYEGVRSFLESRKIDLPYGKYDDPPGKKTICGLGNLKNRLFLNLVESNGVKTYNNAVSQIKYWRSQGLKCAVVSSSKNCQKVLEAAGITDLFESRIDGVTLYDRGLKGKPAPDMFLEAAKELGTKPGNCALIEDAISGVQAGSRGDFALVVGIKRTGKKKSLYENGADIVIDDLKQLDLYNPDIRLYFDRSALSLFSRLSEFNSLIRNKKLVLLLDYDGTLTPIVKHPEDAIISTEMKNVLRKYALKSPLAIISGRDMADVKNMVGIDTLIYAGSHGFQISGPGGLSMEYDNSGQILKRLDKIERALHDASDMNIKGVQIERKRYAVAIHYRNAAEEVVPLLVRKVKEIIDQNPGFKKDEGKKIVEVKPDVDWHKGKAINWILEKLNLADYKEVIPIYIGDDITDEDAFETISDTGIGILVGFHGHRTKARYSLKNVYQVQIFLELLINNILRK